MLRNLAILYVENLGVFVRIEDVGEVLAIGVGNENLSEIVALYHLHDSFYPFAVQSVENIVEEQYRFTYIQSLCQFECEDEGALLTLAAHLLEGIVAQTHFQVVFVDTLRCPTEDEVALSGLDVRFA